MTDDVQKHDEGSVSPYRKAAGGWGALKASTKFIIQSRSIGRSVKSLLRVNQPDGFDCPGCAWPEPGKAHALEFCENGVKAVTWETTGKRVTPEFFAQHPVAQLRHATDHWLESQGRLTQPMRYDRAADRYAPIAWNDAFAMIGDKLKALANPNEAVFYTSGRTSNEAAFLWQLFGRLFGTNNFPDCSNMCHESSGVALVESVGVGKGTVTLDDFEKADAIFVIGQNPGTNHPRMLSELQKAADRGCKIVTINPLKERGLERFAHPQRIGQMLTGRSTTITSLYLQPVVGGDMAVMKGIMKCVLEEGDRGQETGNSQSPPTPVGGLDHTFIAQHTQGFDALKADIENTSWSDIEKHSGLSRDQIAAAAEIYMNAKRIIACWAMGLTQQKHAVATIQSVANLLLLGGHIGREGAGLCPVRGHSNVQGDRTVGITEKPRPAFLARLGEVFGFTPPMEHGYDVVESIEAMHEGRAKVFIAMGGNFAAATPDSRHTAAALERCDLTVHISTKLNRSHTIVGRDALILPCLGRTERDVQAGGEQRVTVEDSMSMVHASHGTNPPASPMLLSEPAIVAGIAGATLGRHEGKEEKQESRKTGKQEMGASQSEIPATQNSEFLADTPNPKSEIRNPKSIDFAHLIADYSRIREKIEAVMPVMFKDYNTRINKPGGFYLGNTARDRQWQTDTGKANFIVHPIPDLTLPAGRLRLMTLRSHDQYNTTVYGMDDRYRGVYGTRQVIFMNEADIAQQSLRDGDFVDVTSHTIEDGLQRTVRGFRIVAYDIPRGCAAGYFPEMNPLVSANSFADRSKTPLSKFVPVTVARSISG